jgi:hypothetical protein
MAKMKLLGIVAVLVLTSTSCSSNSSSSTVMPIASTLTVPATLDGVDLGRTKTVVRAVFDRVFRNIDLTLPEFTPDDLQSTKVAKLSVYRERIADIPLPQRDVNEPGLKISVKSIQIYMQELILYIDDLLNKTVTGNENAIAVSVGKLAYHLGKFEGLKQCYLDLREDC